MFKTNKKYLFFPPVRRKQTELKEFQNPVSVDVDAAVKSTSV